jgi:methionyl-tRNA formyltransferase
MRVIFFGTSDFAVPSLQRLAGSRHEVVLCVTQPDRPQGRGLRRQPSPVKQAAEALNLPLAQPEHLDATICEGRAAAVGALAAYGQMVGPDVLGSFPHGMVGVHPSLLPKYRGAAPVCWAILNGETRTGVSIFKMNERLDAGDILLQESVDILPREDAAALTGRLAVHGADMLLRALDGLAEADIQPRPQDDAEATYAPKLTKAQGAIDWTQPADVIERLVRAMTPWPGATTSWKGEAVKILRAVPRIGEIPAGAAPGSVITVESDRLVITAGRGAVEILDVQPAGRRRQSARQFLAGHRLKPGDLLGGA